MIVQLTLIGRPENIICNMASGSLIGQSLNYLSLPLILSSNFDERSSFRAYGQVNGFYLRFILQRLAVMERKIQVGKGNSSVVDTNCCLN